MRFLKEKEKSLNLFSAIVIGNKIYCSIKFVKEICSIEINK